MKLTPFELILHWHGVCFLEEGGIGEVASGKAGNQTSRKRNVLFGGRAWAQ